MVYNLDLDYTVFYIPRKILEYDFYKKDPDGFVEMTKELKIAKEQLEQYEERWLQLEELSQ